MSILKFRLRYILTSHLKLVISQPQVNLIKLDFPLELIKQVINTRERIHVLNSDFIELVIINAHLRGHILHLYKKKNWSKLWRNTLSLEPFV